MTPRYELSVEREFPAAHAIRLGGELEPVHGHHWRIRATVGGDELDDEGLLCDFHAVERALDAILAPFINRHFNDVPPFDAANPTAELIARHIGDTLAASLPTGVTLLTLDVGEAPGCTARYRPRP